MLARQEGLAGGFYTGIATLHEGCLYYEKVVGDSATLLKETPALELPGTIGLIHTRTPSGGGREWAHPFVDVKGELAYIANGAVGKYDNLPALAEASRRLEAAGHSFKSAQSEPVETYPSSGGRWIHFSEILCHAIAEAYEPLAGKSDRLLRAAIEAYEALPGELVGLCLHARHPDEIVAVRHNKPLEIGRNRQGEVFLASTRIAFPDDITWQMRMPANAGATFRRDGSIAIAPFTKKELLPVGRYPSPVAVEQVLFGSLREHGRVNMEQFFATALSLWPEGTLVEKETVAFDLLASLMKEGLLELETERRPGMEGEGTVPWTWAVLKK